MPVVIIARNSSRVINGKAPGTRATLRSRERIGETMCGATRRAGQAISRNAAGREVIPGGRSRCVDGLGYSPHAPSPRSRPVESFESAARGAHKAVIHTRRIRIIACDRSRPVDGRSAGTLVRGRTCTRSIECGDKPINGPHETVIDIAGIHVVSRNRASRINTLGNRALRDTGACRRNFEGVEDAFGVAYKAVKGAAEVKIIPRDGALGV